MSHLSSIGTFGVNRKIKDGLVKGYKDWYGCYLDTDGRKVVRFSCYNTNCKAESNSEYYVIVDGGEILNVYQPKGDNIAYAYAIFGSTANKELMLENTEGFKELEADDFELIIDNTDTYCGNPYVFLAVK